MATPATRTVGASELIRQFSLWRDIAAREPVYVEYRGQPRLVLVSVELMSAMCGAQAYAGDYSAAREQALLDAIAQPALLIDDRLGLVAAGRAARQYFGHELSPGLPLRAVFPAFAAPVMIALADRVLATGVADRIDLEDPAAPGRRMEFDLSPHPAGLLIVGSSRAVEDARDAAQQVAGAALQTVGALPGHAVVRIGLRGHLRPPDPSLVRLSGFEAAALASARFTSLFDISSRAAVTQAVESAIDAGESSSCAATMLTHGGEPLPVQIAFAPERIGTRITGALALIAMAVPREHG